MKEVDSVIKFRSKNLTRIFRELRRARTRFVINYGGAGSSKSYSQAQFELFKALSKPIRTMVIRKTGATLDDSVVELIKKELLDANGMSSLYTYNKTTKTLTLVNGSQILFRGLDDPEKKKSVQGINRVWIEEASELEEDDFTKLDLRLRGSDDIQLSLTFNPISEFHWIKRIFEISHDHRSEQEDTTVIHSTYKDNPFLDQKFLERLQWLKRMKPEQYRVYGLGQWGSISTGNEFYSSFTTQHIQSTERDPESPLHVSFDFNVVPYNTATIYQVREEKGGWLIQQLDEICLESPNNSTTEVAKELVRRYQDHRQKVFLYGDPSGRARGTRDTAGRNDFGLIHNVLDDHFVVIDQVQGKAPNVSQRGDFANAVFVGWEGFRFVVDEECARSIEDFLYVKMKADGGKHKQKDRDKESGLSWERFGHTSDCFDYFLTSCFSDEYNRYFAGDEPVRAMGSSKRKRDVRF